MMYISYQNATFNVDYALKIGKEAFLSKYKGVFSHLEDEEGILLSIYEKCLKTRDKGAEMPHIPKSSNKTKKKRKNVSN